MLLKYIMFMLSFILYCQYAYYIVGREGKQFFIVCLIFVILRIFIVCKYGKYKIKNIHNNTIILQPKMEEKCKYSQNR